VTEDSEKRPFPTAKEESYFVVDSLLEGLAAEVAGLLLEIFSDKFLRFPGKM
jgi:hypothetical protein